MICKTKKTGLSKTTRSVNDEGVVAYIYLDWIRVGTKYDSKREKIVCGSYMVYIERSSWCFLGRECFSH